MRTWCSASSSCCALSFVARSSTAGDPGDIAALRDIEARIEGELGLLEKMEKHSEISRKNVDGISEEIRKGQKALDVLMRKAESTLRALHGEVSVEVAEASTPFLCRMDRCKRQ